jgi:predicted CXXCH cytochrome family protein
VWIAGVALAGVENTHHDMRLYSLEGEKSVCAYCHVPHGATTDKLLARKGAFEGELGRVGDFCYTCHDGTVVPTALIEAPDGTVGLDALTRSHGLKIGNLPVRTSGLESPDAVKLSGLVPLDSNTGSLPDRMECSGCHDVHNATNPPFLKEPLGTLCQRCHSGRDGRGGGRFGSIEDVGVGNGPHPVGMPVAWSGKDRRRPEQPQPEMVFNDVDPRLRVPTLSGLDLGDPSKHWATGGHLGSGTAAETRGTVMCSTCHSAHSVSKDLLVVPAYRAEQMDDPLCTGCHGSKSSPDNPGGTPYYHPAGAEGVAPYATSTVPQRPLLIAIPTDWPVGKGGALLCATCHRAHQARPGSKCVRDNAKGRKYSCDVCHQPEEELKVKNSHHSTSWSDKSALLLGRTLSWTTGSGEPGDLTDGLTCIDCHAGLAKGAHNW